MKKIKLLILISVFGLLMVSCDRDITEPVVSSDPTEPVVTDLSFTGSFTVAYKDSLITFSWSAADFGFQSSTTYVVQLSPSSDFSTDVSSLISTQELTGTAKVSEVNALLLSWGAEIGQTTTMYYRIAASITSSLIAYSNIKSKTFTPYEALIDYPMLYVPGSYQGWSPGAENGRLYSYDFNTIYSCIIRLSDGSSATTEFKITEVANWNGTNYGGTLTKSGTSYSGTLDASGGNLVVDAGTYIVTVDKSTLSITLTKTNDWGIIGSATAGGWSSDTNMFYNGQREMWEITADFTAGAFKFRANDDWTVNYGDTGADGTLDSGGTDISLSTAGNYTIRMDLINLVYTVKKN